MVRNLVESAGPKMEKAVEHFGEDLKSLRTGRASVAMLDGVMVEYYGAVQPLKAMASGNTPDARSITVSPWDKGALGPMEKAKEATADDVKFAEAELNKKIEQTQRRIEELEAAKSKEIMEV